MSNENLSLYHVMNLLLHGIEVFCIVQITFRDAAVFRSVVLHAKYVSTMSIAAANMEQC